MKGFIDILGDKQKELSLLDSIDQLMISKKKKQYEILRELGLDSRVIGLLRHKHNRQLKRNNSYVFDRYVYCKLIDEEGYTIKEISILSGYSTSSVRGWYSLYKREGIKMLSKSVVYKGE